MTMSQLNVLSVKGLEDPTVRDSDLNILMNELSKKIKTNIVTDIINLDLAHFTFIHDFSGFFQDRYKFKQLTRKLLSHNLNQKSPTGFEIYFSHYLNRHKSILDTLRDIKHWNLPYVKVMPFSVINYGLNKNKFKELVINHLKLKNTPKALVRFGHCHNPSFIIDIWDESSFDIDIPKYIDNNLRGQDIMIYPIKSSESYMEGVISMIYVAGKYSHCILKKPISDNPGQRQYTIQKYKPPFIASKSGDEIVKKLYSENSYPIIQVNLCSDNHIIRGYYVTKVNYIDPKMYLNLHKHHVKKIRKAIMDHMRLSH